MLTPLMTGGRRTGELTVCRTTGAVGVFVRALAICSCPPDCDLLETHPTVDCASAEPCDCPPIEIKMPDPFGTTRYHCGVLRSTTMRVAAGFREYRPARTSVTSPRLTTIL